MPNASKKLMEYINDKGIKKSKILRETGLKEYVLYKKRLSADEFLKICRFLDLDPFSFLEDEK